MIDLATDRNMKCKHKTQGDSYWSHVDSQAALRLPVYGHFRGQNAIPQMLYPAVSLQVDLTSAP